MKRFWGGVLLGALALGSGLGLTATATWLLVQASTQPPILTLMVAIAAVRGFGIARPVFRYLERLVTHDAAFRQLAQVRTRAYTALVDGGAGQSMSDGELLARFVDDVDAVQDRLLRVRLPIVTTALVSGAAVLLATVLAPTAGLTLAVLLGVVGVGVPFVAAAANRRSEQAVAPLRGRLHALIAEGLQGAPDLVAYGAAERWCDEIAAAEAELAAVTRRITRLTGIASGVATLGVGGAVIAMMWVGIPALEAGTLTPPTFAVLAVTPLALAEAIAALPAAGSLIHRVRAAAGRLRGIDDAPPATVDPEWPVPLPAAPYHLQLTEVTARWGDNDVLRGVTLELPPGRRVAIVGESGAGKSTLAAVLVRLLDFRGEYLVNGVSARDLAADELRGIIGLVAADTHIFASTLRENIRLARPAADDAEIVMALRRAGFGRPLDLWLGEGGALLSGGERQRVALARVLLADTPIVVLDEPVAHLDSAAASALLAEVMAASAGRTVVLITHRREGLDLVDEVWQLRGGRLEPAAGPADLALGIGYAYT